MLDLETLGNSAGCAIVSIGAVGFDRYGAQPPGSEFYRVINLESSMLQKMRIDAGTLKWWFKQSPEARAVFDELGGGLKNALIDFCDWYLTNQFNHLWAHGAAFDPPILESALTTVGLAVPWKFHLVRDTRTLFELIGCYPDRSKGVHHHALDDAKAQAVTVQQAFLKLNKTRK